MGIKFKQISQIFKNVKKKLPTPSSVKYFLKFQIRILFQSLQPNPLPTCMEGAGKRIKYAIHLCINFTCEKYLILVVFN